MSPLTGQEKQEIIRYIEAGKPLPQKYRFLLFEDKREVELVWNGKTDEVCTIVLPFQTSSLRGICPFHPTCFNTQTSLWCTRGGAQLTLNVI